MKKQSISSANFILFIILTLWAHENVAMPSTLPDNTTNLPEQQTFSITEPTQNFVAQPSNVTLTQPIIQAIPNSNVTVTMPSSTPTTPQTPISTTEKSESLAIDMGTSEQTELATPSTQPSTEIITPNIPTELLSSTPAENLEKNIFLNFDNADLSSFINYIAEIKKLNLIPDKSLEAAKISLSVHDPITINGAWNIFLTVLEMSGFSIIKVGDVYKVIPKDQKLQQPLPVYINIPPDKIPEDDSNARYVMFLDNLGVSDYKDLVRSMLSDKGDVYDIKEVNGYIISDKCLNIRSVSKLLLELDQMGGAETASFIKLKNANATDVKNLLDVLMKKPDVSPLARLLGKTAEGNRDYFPPGTRVIAEERLNALILIGDPAPIKKIEDFIVNYIDTELKDAKSPLHVYELQYTDAQQIADLLKDVTLPPDSAAGQAASKYGAIRGGVKYFRGMTFKVDKDGNRLVVSSTDKVDWKLLKKTIQDLDKPQPQIAIETLILTVNVTDEKELSGAIRNKKHGQIGKNIDFQSAALTTPSLEQKDSGSDPVSLLGNMISQITQRKGLATMTIGNSAIPNIWAIFQALKTQTNTSILSQPFLTVTNKTTARVKVGNEQRILQEQTEGGLTGWEPVNADTELIITPQINLDGLIRLDIETNINEFLNKEATQKVLRNLKTNVSVADGQVLVLGGFVRTQTIETTSKTPILGDIPLLGWLFKGQNRTISKDYIFIFISPTIMKPREIPGMSLYTKMKLHEATNDIESSIQTKRTPDPVYNWFFNPEKENYSHKVIDFANARYQPTTVDIKNDPYYRAQTKKAQDVEEDDEENGNSKKENIQVAPIIQNTTPQPQVTVDTSNTPAPTTPVNQVLENMPQPAETLTTEIQTPPSAPPVQETVISPNIPQEIAPQTLPPAPTTNLTENEYAEPIIQQGIVEQMPVENSKHKTLKLHPEEKIIPQEIESIEDFKSASDSQPTTQHEKTSVDMKKRNRLKEFLSKNPMLSQNRSRNGRSSRRGLT